MPAVIPLIIAGVEAGTAVYQANNAKSAAATQAAAGQDAIRLTQQEEARNQARLAPYQQAGAAAVNRLGALLGPTQPGQFATSTNAPTPTTNTLPPPNVTNPGRVSPVPFGQSGAPQSPPPQTLGGAMASGAGAGAQAQAPPQQTMGGAYSAQGLSKTGPTVQIQSPLDGSVRAIPDDRSMGANSQVAQYLAKGGKIVG